MLRRGRDKIKYEHCSFLKSDEVKNQTKRALFFMCFPIVLMNSRPLCFRENQKETYMMVMAGKSRAAGTMVV